jgi:hypothetical protein
VSRESLTWPRGWRSGSMSWLAVRPELEEEDSGGTVVEPPLQRRRLDASPAIAASGNEECRRDPATDWLRNHGASESPQSTTPPEVQRHSRVAVILAERHSDLDNQVPLMS